MHTATTRYAGRTRTALLAALALLATILVPAVAAPTAAAASDVKVKIRSVKTAQVSRTKTRTRVKVAIHAPKSGATKRVRVRVNPTGKVAKTGKTITRSVKARWSKGAYRATVNIRTGGPGKVIVRTKIGGKTYKAVRKSPGKLTTKITGWDASSTVKAGTKVTDTIKVTPARGRKVLLQQRVGSKWVTRQQFRAKKKTAKIKVTLTGPTANGPAKTRWRVRVPATNHAKAKKTKVRVLTREGSPPPDQPNPGDPPAPDPERPGWPQWCGNLFGEPMECYRPTISTVLDRWTYNPRCYLEQECWRAGTTLDDDGFDYQDYNWPTRWGSPEVYAKGWVNWKPVAAPDFIDHLNAYRQSASHDPEYGDGKHRHILRPAPWSTTVDGYTVPGQGGHAQMWAMHLGNTHGGELVHSDSRAQREWINERWPDARGHWWMCSENLSRSTTSGSSKGLFAWPSSPPHRSALLNTQASYSSFGAALADNGSTIAVFEGCRLVKSKDDWDPAYEADGVTPAIWQPPAGWRAPTN